MRSGGPLARDLCDPWIGRKCVAFVPLYRTNAIPPDAIPPEWETQILRRVVFDPRVEANGADRCTSCGGRDKVA
jgi:hypothetical protein